MVGLRPGLDKILNVNPLVPDDWDWFCLDDVLYKGKQITITWDKTGEKYGNGKGLRVYVDGKLKSKSPDLIKLEVEL